jgi:hypothetical protein
MLKPLLDRQDFHETAKRVVESMSFLLFELQEIRDKYMLETPHLSDDHLEPTARRPISKPHESFRLRSWANQKHKSVFAVVTWAIRDERRFDKKVKRLGEMITGLEDIARTAWHPPDRFSRYPPPC